MDDDEFLDDQDQAELPELPEVDPVQRLLDRERFTRARFDVGYERADVDKLVAALRSAYDEDGHIDGVIESHVLHTAGFRDGYEVSEVEAWLNDLVVESGTELGERPEVVATAAGPRSNEEIKAAKRSRSRAAGTPGTAMPSVITERKSLIERLRRSK